MPSAEITQSVGIGSGDLYGLSANLEDDYLIVGASTSGAGSGHLYARAPTGFVTSTDDDLSLIYQGRVPSHQYSFGSKFFTSPRK